MNWKHVLVVALAFQAARIADRYLGVSRLFSVAA
jgi:hypothetical protein